MPFRAILKKFAALGDIGGDELIGLGAQLLGRESAGSEGAHNRLEVGHEQRRGHSFAGDVADDDGDGGIAETEGVVVVAAYVAGGLASGGELETGKLGQLLGHEGLLDFASELEILLVEAEGAGAGFRFLLELAVALLEAGAGGDVEPDGAGGDHRRGNHHAIGQVQVLPVPHNAQQQQERTADAGGREADGQLRATKDDPIEGKAGGVRPAAQRFVGGDLQGH